jgi:hypothetical protein
MMGGLARPFVYQGLAPSFVTCVEAWKSTAIILATRFSEIVSDAQEPFGVQMHRTPADDWRNPLSASDITDDLVTWIFAAAGVGQTYDRFRIVSPNGVTFPSGRTLATLPFTTLPFNH